MSLNSLIILFATVYGVVASYGAQSSYARPYQPYQPPPSVGSWNEWGSWGECSAPCGGGTYTRTRTCYNPCDACSCVGESVETQACNPDPCNSYVRPPQPPPVIPMKPSCVICVLLRPLYVPVPVPPPILPPPPPPPPPPPVLPPILPPPTVCVTCVQVPNPCVSCGRRRRKRESLRAALRKRSPLPKGT
ncbi:hypothetical protein Q1695_008327 [Nippostrongylus brasiliensis]|nr:hypothetical protein Q1695_008327 [Nippostrongylus brasiliensis]